MAYTKIIPIRYKLYRALDYVTNEQKTALDSTLAYIERESATAMEDALSYDGAPDEIRFISAQNYRSGYAYEDMIETRKRWGKDSPNHVLGYHVIQSFASGEVEPQIAHQIGQEFASRCFSKYEVVIATHLDKGHLHNHLVINAVSFEDGRMYRNDFRDYFRDIRGISDSLCKEHGLSIILTGQGSSKNYGEWRAQKEGKPNLRDLVKRDVDAAIRKASTNAQFMQILKSMGHIIKPKRKHLTIKPPGAEGYIRVPSLKPTDEYTPEAIARRILSEREEEPNQGADEKQTIAAPMQEIRLIQGVRHKTGCYKGSFKRNPPLIRTGFVALYFHYVHLLCKVKRLTANRRTTFMLYKESYKIKKYIGQLNLLSREGIETTSQMASFQKELDNHIHGLCKERVILKKRLKSPKTDEDEKERLLTQIKAITAQLRPLYKERRWCKEIYENSTRIRETVRYTYHNEPTHEKRKEGRHEPSRI